MTSRIATTTVDCRNAYSLSRFWLDVLGYIDEPDEPAVEGKPDCLIVDPDAPDADSVLFLEVPEAKTVKNRLHFDLMPTDRTRDEEVERVLALGASMYDDLRNPDGTGWAVLTDPEGNEFCILRSAAERST